MYLVSDMTGTEARDAAKRCPPFGPGFPAELAELAERLEVWGTSCDDPGPDKTVFKLFDEGGRVIGERELAGY